MLNGQKLIAMMESKWYVYPFEILSIFYESIQLQHLMKYFAAESNCFIGT